MAVILQYQISELAHVVDMFCNKRHTCMSRLSYLRGIHLCHLTLKKTCHELQDIYFRYALRPDIKLSQPIVISCVLCMHMMFKKMDTQASASMIQPLHH